MVGELGKRDGAKTKQVDDKMSVGTIERVWQDIKEAEGNESIHKAGKNNRQ